MYRYDSQDIINILLNKADELALRGDVTLFIRSLKRLLEERDKEFPTPAYHIKYTPEQYAVIKYTTFWTDDKIDLHTFDGRNWYTYEIVDSIDDAGLFALVGGKIGEKIEDFKIEGRVT